jgi:Putative peptidoglycan binding domain
MSYPPAIHCLLSQSVWLLSFALLVTLPPARLEARQQSQSLTIASVNDAEWQPQSKPSTSLFVKLQALLDRAHVSPGEIDGTLGENTRKAIAAYGEIKGLEPTEEVNEQLWRALIADSEAALVTRGGLTTSRFRPSEKGCVERPRPSS